MEWIIARWVTFLTTLLAVGACAVGVGLVPRLVADEGERAAIARESARIGVVACLLLIPASVLRLADQLLALRAPGDPVMSGLAPLITSTMWGAGFVWQSMAGLVALAGFRVATHTPRAPRAWAVAVAGSAVLGATLSLQGHAIGTETLTAVAVAADVTHVLGAGVWLGGIGVIGWMGVALPDSDGNADPVQRARAEVRLKQLVPLVPPAALTGAAALVASGVVSSLLHLRAVDDLWASRWGQLLMVKVVLLTAIAGFGALNWQRLGRRLAEAEGTRALRRSLLIEIGIALVALLVTSLLVVTPLPGE